MSDALELVTVGTVVGFGLSLFVWLIGSAIGRTLGIMDI